MKRGGEGFFFSMEVLKIASTDIWDINFNLCIAYALMLILIVNDFKKS